MKKILLPATAIAALLAFLLLKPEPSPMPTPLAFGQPGVFFEPGPDGSTFTARRAGFTLELGPLDSRVLLTRGENRSALQLHLEDAQPSSARPENLLPGVSNYFLGEDPRAWRTGVPHYARVRYENVYPGVDLVYYGANGTLEYDFLLAPGADPARIRMSYQGARAVKVDAEGNLRIAVDGGEVVHRKPVSYQHVDGVRRSVASAFRLLREAGRQVVGFELGDYDLRVPLTIDPVLSYATYLGGSDDFEDLTTMVVDAAGAAYVAGVTNSVDFPVTPGVVQPARAGTNGTDAFVAKLNPAGTAFEYVTYLGGSGFEEVFNLVVDAGGNAYVAGATISTDFPVTPGAAQATAGGGGASDVFVARLNPTGGTLLYATYLGGNQEEPTSGRLGGLAVAANGDAYVYGTTSSTDFPTTPGAPQTSRGNPAPLQDDSDAFVTRINADGTAFVFSTYHGGSGYESTDDSNGESRCLGIDGAGSVWIAGSTESVDFPVTAGAYDTTFNGPVGPLLGGDYFVARFDTNAGTRTYSTYLGGDGAERLIGLEVDATGNAYVAGGTESTNFPTTAGAPDSTYGGGSGDVALAKLDPTGATLLHATYLGGGLNELPEVLRVDAAGTMYVGGQTRTSNFPVTPGAADTTHNGDTDGFIARLNATGTGYHFVTFAGGSDPDFVSRMEVDAAGNVYALLGDTSGDAFLTAGARVHAGDLDDYFVKLSADGSTFLDASYVGGLLEDFSLALAVDAQENLYLGGITTSSNYPVTPGAPQLVKAGAAGAEDMFIVKFATTPGGPVVQPGTLALSAASYAVGEAAGTVVVNVARTGGATGAVGATCTAASGGSDTAVAGSDYTAGTATVSWADGDAASKTCSFAITNDMTLESAETFTVTLSNATGGASIGTPASATVTISDDDLPPAPQPGSVAFDPASYSLNENGGSVTLTLTRTAGADGAISVSVASGGGSASAGSDYTAVSQVVNWADGDSASKSVTLDVLDDAVDEPNETVTIGLSNATGGATLGVASATLTIVDDDATPVPPQPPAQPSNVNARYGGALDGVLVGMLLGLIVVALYGRRRARGRQCQAPVMLAALTGCALATLVPEARAAEGWYLGVRGGVAESTQDAGDLERALDAEGYDVTVNADENQPAFSLFGGYRWSNGLALETSVFELGQFDAVVSGMTADPAGLPANTEAVLADSGRGISAALAWSWRIGEHFGITPRVGAYYWESRHTVESDAGRITNRDFGVDLMGGVSFDLYVDENWTLGLSCDAWAAGDRNDVRSLSAFLSYRF